MKLTINSCEPWSPHTHHCAGCYARSGVPGELGLGRAGTDAGVCWGRGRGASPFPGAPPGGAHGSFAVWPLTRPVAGRRGGKSRGPSRPPPRGPHAPARVRCREGGGGRGRQGAAASLSPAGNRTPSGWALSFSGEKASPQPGFPSRPAPSPISWPIYETGLSSCLGLVGFPYVFWP